MMNAVLSGNIYGGVADNKITAFAGETSTGKTFFALGVVRHFLDQNPDGGVVYYDTESAVTKKMMQERGIDTKRVMISEPSTIQEFRSKAMQLISNYNKLKDKPPMLIVLDSLGMLPTAKEVTDMEEGKDTRDMTRSQLIRGAFRALTLKLAKAKIPMIVTNHVYDTMNAMFPSKEVSGGGGIKYAASAICVFGKAKEKEGTEIVGNVIRVKMDKSRLSRENKVASVLLKYDTGLDRYYGLVDIAIKHGIFQKGARQVEMPDGTKVFEKSIYKKPEKYLDPYLEQINEACMKEFSYGNHNNEVEIDDIEEFEDEENERN